MDFGYYSLLFGPSQGASNQSNGPASCLWKKTQEALVEKEFRWTTETITIEEFVFGILSGAVTISEERKVCTGSEKFFKMCESNEVGLKGTAAAIRINVQPLIRKTTIIIMIITWNLYVFQLDLTFHLFVCALAGAGAAVIAMVTIIVLK